jgi:hypothetical protein
MIQIAAKPYRILLWKSDRDRADAATLQLDLDSREEAIAVFETHRDAGQYRMGLLIEWHKVSGIWNLLDRYP